MFNTTTNVVEDTDAPQTRTRNPNLPPRQPLGLRYLVDTTDMELSELDNPAFEVGTMLQSKAG